MTKILEAKLNMYKAVLNHCAANTAIVNTVTAFQTAYTALQTKVGAISSATQQQAQVITGLSANKTALRDDLCAKAADLASILFAWATAVNNLVVKDQVNFSPSDISRLKDELLVPNCKNIMTIATTNMAVLGAYGVTANTVTTLDAAVTAYSATIAAPRNAITQRTTYTSNIEQLFKDADAILRNQMDKLAVQFKKTQPDFYNTYFNNRIIVDAATSSTKIKGTITAAADKALIAGADVQVASQDVSATTGIDGTFTLAVKPGLFDVLITKQGFQNKTISIQAKLGKETVADAELN